MPYFRWEDVVSQAEGDAAYAPLSTARTDGTTVEVFPKLHTVAARTFVSGDVAFTFFTPAYNATVTTVRTATASPAAASLTAAKLGLYTVSGNDLTLVARTANDTTLFTSTFTQYTRTFDTTGGFPASYNLVKGQRYAMAIFVAGTTMPQLYGNGFTMSVLNTLSPRLTAVATGQTDLPATFTASSGLNFAYWGRFE